jgi:hypothetical protein
MEKTIWTSWQVDETFVIPWLEMAMKELGHSLVSSLAPTDVFCQPEVAYAFFHIKKQFMARLYVSFLKTI